MTKPTGASKAAGRQTDTFDPDTGDEILARIALGQTLTQVCKAEDMPELRTVLYWTRRHPSFSRSLARARMEQMFQWADDVVDIAEGTWSGSSIKVGYDDPMLIREDNKHADGKGGYVLFKYERGHVREANLIIRTKMDLMKKFNPEQFGDRQIIDLRENYMEMTDDELLVSFVREAKRAGMTIERMAEIFEEYDTEEDT